MIKIFIYSLITLFLMSCKQPIQKNILKEDYNLLMINDSSYIEIYINSKSHVSLITKNVIHNKDTHSTDYIYENNKLSYFENTINQKSNGCFVGFHDNGSPSVKIEYKNGTEFGKSTYWWENGVVSYEGDYNFNYNSECDTIKSKNCEVYSFHGGLWGHEECVKPKNGKWISYYKNGQKKFVEFYDCGEPIGTWYNFDSLGTLIDSVNKD